MIIKGNQRGHAKNLADHLMNSKDNETVEVAEIRGVLSDNLGAALSDIEAVSLGTKCQQPLYSLSINPSQSLTREQYTHAIDAIERKLNLTHQPRVVVFHHKKSQTTGNVREHCHVVWSRINSDTMTAIQMSHDRRKLRDIAQDLARDFSHDLPEGLKAENDNKNYAEDTNNSWADINQSARSGLSPEQRRDDITQAYQASDTGKTFQTALKEKGYHLAKGDRRAYVVLDTQGEVYSLTRHIKKVKTKVIKEKLKDLPVHALPSVDELKKTLKHRKPAQKKISKASNAVSSPHQDAKDTTPSFKDLQEHLNALSATFKIHIQRHLKAKKHQVHALENRLLKHLTVQKERLLLLKNKKPKNQGIFKWFRYPTHQKNLKHWQSTCAAYIDRLNTLENRLKSIQKYATASHQGLRSPLEHHLIQRQKQATPQLVQDLLTTRHQLHHHMDTHPVFKPHQDALKRLYDQFDQGFQHRLAPKKHQAERIEKTLKDHLTTQKDKIKTHQDSKPRDKGLFRGFRHKALTRWHQDHTKLQTRLKALQNRLNHLQQYTKPNYGKVSPLERHIATQHAQAHPKLSQDLQRAQQDFQKAKMEEIQRQWQRQRQQQQSRGRGR